MADQQEGDGMTDLEIDLLLLYFTFSDQYGRVDTVGAAHYAAKKLGVLMNREHKFTLNQNHIDALMNHGVIPDTRELFAKLLLKQ